MLYFAVRAGSRCKVIECGSWQEACMIAFGCISDDQEVLCFGDTIGKDVYATLPTSNRWFKPIIINPVNGITLTPENAYGAPELSQMLLSQADRMRHATDLDVIEDANNLVQPYLKDVPERIRTKFAEVYNVSKVRVSHTNRDKSADKVRTSSVDDQG